MKVFVVSTGCYSDRGAYGAYSDEAKANEVAAVFHQVGRESDVEAFELDAEPAPQIKQYWVATIKLSTGEIHEGRERGRRQYDPGPFWNFHDETHEGPHPRLIEPRNYAYTIGNDQEVESTVSQAHANKLAAEFRQEVLRLQQLGLIAPEGTRAANWRIPAVNLPEDA